MRTLILGAVISLSLLGGSGLAVSIPASAASDIAGDLTGDGTTDPYSFTPSADGTACTITISPGDTSGPYAGKTFTLDVPVPPSSTGCPDLSAAGDTAGDGKTRVALSWFFCATDELDLLVAENDSFAIHTYPTIDCASRVQTADLNGDGRADFFEWSDNPGGLWTYLGQPDGLIQPNLTGGAMFSTGMTASPQLMTGNRDGRTELLLSEGDAGFLTDIAVYAYQAPTAHIAGPTGGAGALYQGDVREATASDVNGDGWKDVNVATPSSTFTAFQRPDHSFYLGLTAKVLGEAARPRPVAVAQVAQTSLGGRKPTGLVTFIVDGMPTTPVKVLGGKAHTQLPTMSAGVHTLVASYSGDSAHPAVSSPPVLITVP